MTNTQKIEMAQQGKAVLVALQTALTQLHKIDTLMAQKAASSLISDVAFMIHSEIMTRCKP